MAAPESRGVGASHSNLHQQDLSKLDVGKLTAVSPEVISRQATINIGTIGHVAHGKSTVVKAISGVQTVRFKNELERNITIKLERLPENVVQKYVKSRVGGGGKRSKGEYKVEAVLAARTFAQELFFFIKWTGWDSIHNTWEPLSNLNCPQLLRAFLDLLLPQLQELRERVCPAAELTREKLEALWHLRGSTACDLEHQEAYLAALYTLQAEGGDPEEVGALEEMARRGLQLAELHRQRELQLQNLKLWEKRLNAADPDAPLSVENCVDLENPPENFQYITRNIPAKGVVIPEEPPIGCSCKSCNVRSGCTCALEAGLFAYTFKRRLRVDVGTPIYECNKKCSCPPDCTNRLVQAGRKVRLRIFRTSSGCGWGVCSEQRIPKGSFVCQYVGELISYEEAERRSRAKPLTAPTYLFDLDFNSAEPMYTLDAMHMGNVSHFINHSCEPNLGVWAVWGNCLDPNLPMLALFATRDIAPKEEISFDYNQSTANSDAKGGPTTPVKDGGVGSPVKAGGAGSPLKVRLEPSSPLAARPSCHCKTASCRKFLF